MTTTEDAFAVQAKAFDESMLPGLFEAHKEILRTSPSTRYLVCVVRTTDTQYPVKVSVWRTDTAHLDNVLSHAIIAATQPGGMCYLVQFLENKTPQTLSFWDELAKGADRGQMEAFMMARSAFRLALAVFMKVFGAS